MDLDPDVVRSKPRSTITTWLRFAAADAMFDDWRETEAQAAFDRQLARVN